MTRDAIFPYPGGMNSQPLPVVVLDTVGVVVVIRDEGRPLECAGTGAAAETVGVETLAHGLQHPVGDLLPAPGTHGQGTLRRSRKLVSTLNTLKGALCTLQHRSSTLKTRVASMKL